MNKIFSSLHESGAAKFLIPIGITLVVFGAIVFVINIKNQNYVKIEATVINVQEEQETNVDSDGTYTTTVYNVTVNYVVDGDEYTQTLDNVSKHKVGDKMAIYYNPLNPNQVTQTKSLILPIGIMIVGVLLLVVGIISALKVAKVE